MTLQNQLKGYRSKRTGETFESLISAACEMYKKEKIAKIEKQEEPIKMLSHPDRFGHFKACYKQRSGVDYKGTLKGGRSIVFEAKHTDKDKIEQSRVKAWQMEYLKEHAELGAETFVLVSFHSNNFYRIPFDKWENMKEFFGRVSLKEEMIQDYRIPMKGLNIDFLKGISD